MPTPDDERDWILEERDGDVVTLTFNSPERLNAMTETLGEAFAARVARLVGASEVRALILTGAGRAFSAGGDLDMIEARAEQAQARPVLARRGVRDFMRNFYGLFLAVRDLPFPTLAAINGHAIGAGLCVALACDIRYVAREARLGLNFTRLGLHPGMGATWTLPRLIGPGPAAELLYTSRLIDGEEAARIGLASRVLPADEVLAATRATAREIAGCAPRAVRGVKRALARSLDVGLGDQLDFEASEQAVCFESRDVLAGIAAAKARKDPRFEGR
jgi:enoyl-CoA hydratase/carnithine racemase